MANVMIVGSGAREHAMAQAYLSSPHVSKVLVTPGNQGMLRDGIDIDASTSLKDKDSFLRVASEHKPYLIDVAQDDALAAGTVDLLSQNNFRVFGPTREAARVEWDKKWSREFMKKHNLPIPKYKSFTIGNQREALEYTEGLLKQCNTVFFKASGLYAGKGVIPTTNMDEALAAVSSLKGMGDASKVFLVEEGMSGEEFSYYAMVDGKNYVCFKSAQDNKRVWNLDKGPNTGGMGCNSPALVTRGLERKIENEIIKPTIAGLNAEGISYKGILYLGGMVSEKGDLKIVEFNSRWGDPECHVILPGVKNDYFELVNAAIDGRLNQVTLDEDDLTRVCVIGASAGYPGHYEKGKKLIIGEGKDYADFLSAGIEIQDGNMYTAGGRVFSFIGSGKDVVEARQKALQAMACCSIEDNGLHYRTDIAWRDVQRVQGEK